MRTRIALSLALGLALLHPAASRAQTVRPGMTEAQVRSLLGQPTVVRAQDDWVYLFYPNGCAVRCGSDDVVFLRDDRVVTAVFRTARRRFVGTPAAAALEAAEGDNGPGNGRAAGAPPREEGSIRVSPSRVRGSAPGRPGARVEGIRVTVPGTENAATGGTLIRPGDRAFSTGSGAARADTMLADTAMDQTRQNREQGVTPRTVLPGSRDAARPDSALDARRQERERQVQPRTIRPQTTGTPAPARPTT